MSDLVCISCAELHSEIDFKKREYSAFVGKCLYCDLVKVGIFYISELQKRGSI